MLVEPAQERFERGAVGGRVLVDDELRLSARALERHDREPGPGRRDRRAVITTDDVQAEVHSGRGARRGEDVTLVDVEDVWVDHDPRVATREFGGRKPVRRRTPAVEE